MFWGWVPFFERILSTWEHLVGGKCTAGGGRRAFGFQGPCSSRPSGVASAARRIGPSGTEQSRCQTDLVGRSQFSAVVVHPLPFQGLDPGSNAFLDIVDGRVGSSYRNSYSASVGGHDVAFAGGQELFAEQRHTMASCAC